MPKCILCDTDTPVTCFILLREYKEIQGRFWYFCSPDHLLSWLLEQEDITRFGITSKEKLITWDWEKDNAHGA